MRNRKKLVEATKEVMEATENTANPNADLPKKMLLLLRT